MVGLLGKMALGAAAGVAKGYGDTMYAKAQLEGKAAYDQLLLQTKSNIRVNELGIEAGLREASAQSQRTFDKNENQKTRQANITTAGLKGNSRGIMSDSQLIDRVVKANSQVDQMGNKMNPKWGGVIAQFKGMGRPDLIRASVPPEFQGLGGAGGQNASNKGMSEELAFKQATAEASGNAGLFSLDKTDFAQDGGNQEAFISRRTLELMGKGQAPQRKGLMPNGPDAKPKTQEVRAGTPPEGHPNAKQAPDGNWYVENGAGPDGKMTYARIDPKAATGGANAAPQAKTVDRKAERRQTEQSTIDQAKAQLNKLQAQKDQREQRRADAAQKGHNSPMFVIEERMAKNKIKALEDKIARAQGNLDLIGPGAEGQLQKGSGLGRRATNQ